MKETTSSAAEIISRATCRIPTCSLGLTDLFVCFVVGFVDALVFVANMLCCVVVGSHSDTDSLK